MNRLPKQHTAVLRHEVCCTVFDPADIGDVIRALFDPLVAHEGGP
jgi:hypothetical protein